MQTKSLTATLFWFATAAVALCGPRFTVSGKVVDSVGKPIRNATVMVYHAGVKNGYSTFCPSCYEDCGKRTTTDESGLYTIAKLNPSLWFELLVVREGYAPTFIRVEDLPNGPVPTAVLNIRKSIIDPTSAVKGHLVDGEGDVVRDAVVKSEGIEIDKGSMIGTIPGLDPLAVTNQNGDFELVYTEPAKRMLLSIEARTLAPKFVVLVTGKDRQTIELSKGAS